MNSGEQLQLVKQGIDVALNPYLGKVEYGSLRQPPKEWTYVHKCHLWSIPVEIADQTEMIRFFYFPDVNGEDNVHYEVSGKPFHERYGSFMYESATFNDLSDALGQLSLIIAGIPQQRKKRICDYMCERLDGLNGGLSNVDKLDDRLTEEELTYANRLLEEMKDVQGISKELDAVLRPVEGNFEYGNIRRIGWQDRDSSNVYSWFADSWSFKEVLHVCFRYKPNNTTEKFKVGYMLDHYNYPKDFDELSDAVEHFRWIVEEIPKGRMRVVLKGAMMGALTIIDNKIVGPDEKVDYDELFSPREKKYLEFSLAFKTFLDRVMKIKNN